MPGLFHYVKMVTEKIKEALSVDIFLPLRKKIMLQNWELEENFE